MNQTCYTRLSKLSTCSCSIGHVGYSNSEKNDRAAHFYTPPRNVISPAAS